ncbi:MAG: PAS domain S-box protein [Verrucomicrobiota bacterium]
MQAQGGTQSGLAAESDFPAGTPALGVPGNEAERLAVLGQYEILDTGAESSFDDLAHLASQLCGTPIALISLVDGQRQWFKSRVGLEIAETPREDAFCAHTILGSGILEVPNALEDARFRNSPLVSGEPCIRFYAGTPLTTSDGYSLGALCVIDRVSRQLTEGQRDALVRLGRQVVSQLELRRTRRELQGNLASIRNAEQERDRFFNLSLDLLCIAGFDGYFKQLNPVWEATLGYTRTELLARPFVEFVHPEDRASTVAVTGKIREGESLITFENRYLAKDGSCRWLQWAANPFPEKELIYASARDITERKVREAELREANARLANSEEALIGAIAGLHRSHEELKATQLQLAQAEKLESIGVMAAGIAHEVKNPLQIILLAARSLSMILPADNEEVGSSLAEIRSAVGRADAIVRGLLEFSAHRQLALQAQDLNAVLEQSLGLTRYEFEKGRVTVVREFGTHLPSVALDKPKMEQVFINLFLNAIQAMPSGGRLTVTSGLACWSEEEIDPSEAVLPEWRSGEPVVKVEICDSGSGIAREKLSRIFDPFFTTKPAGQGTGLGLTVARNIVSLHGGVIVVRNRPEGGVAVVLWMRTSPQTPARP